LYFLGWAKSPHCPNKNWRKSRQTYGVNEESTTESTTEYREYLMSVVGFAPENEAAAVEEARAAAAPNDADQQHAALQQMVDYDAVHGPGSFLALFLTFTGASAPNKKHKRTHDQM
jgi:hypothetical protein